MQGDFFHGKMGRGGWDLLARFGMRARHALLWLRSALPKLLPFYRRTVIVLGSLALIGSLLLPFWSFGITGLRSLSASLVFGSGTVSYGDNGAASDEPSLDIGISSGGAEDTTEQTSGEIPLEGEATSEDPSNFENEDGVSSGETVKTPSLTVEELYAYTPPLLTGNAVAIRPVDLSAGSLLALSNMTSYTPDLEGLVNALPERNSLVSEETLLSGEPLVLILHTHGSESYAEEGAATFSSNTAPRSTDPAKTVVSVGDTLASALRLRGIAAVHHREMLDVEDFSSAYDRSKQVILSYLEKYPSIRYVFDLHRDSISVGDDSTARPVTLNERGEPTAQVMLLVGTDEKGAYHPDWEENLSYALALQSRLLANCEGLMRPINLRGATFNEQYTPASLLLEVGAAGNTLAEAKRAALLLAAAIADDIYDSLGGA